MQSIAIGYGKVNFSHASVTLASFVVESPFIRTLASKKLAKIGGTQRTPVSSHPEIEGWLYQDQCSAPTGIIVAVQMQQKYRGSGIRDGAIFIRVRPEGAALLITASLPHDSKSLLPSNRHTVFSGNGDILTLKELQDIDIHPSEHFVGTFMEEEEVEECFDVQVLRPAVSAAPVVEVHTTPEGEKVVLQVPQSARRIRVKR